MKPLSPAESLPQQMPIVPVDELPHNDGTSVIAPPGGIFEAVYSVENPRAQVVVVFNGSTIKQLTHLEDRRQKTQESLFESLFVRGDVTVGLFNGEGIDILKSNYLAELVRRGQIDLDKLRCCQVPDRRGPPHHYFSEVRAGIIDSCLKENSEWLQRGISLTQLKAEGLSDDHIAAIASGRRVQDVRNLTGDQAYALYLHPSLTPEHVSGVNSWFTRYEADHLDVDATYEQLRHNAHQSPRLTGILRWWHQNLNDVKKVASRNDTYVANELNIAHLWVKLRWLDGELHRNDISYWMYGVTCAPANFVLFAIGATMVALKTLVRVIFNLIGGAFCLYGLIPPNFVSNLLTGAVRQAARVADALLSVLFKVPIAVLRPIAMMINFVVTTLLYALMIVIAFIMMVLTSPCQISGQEIADRAPDFGQYR